MLKLATKLGLTPGIQVIVRFSERQTSRHCQYLTRLSVLAVPANLFLVMRMLLVMA